ncbi:MAG TPA: hypothetical protein VGS17_08615 [Candidatus Limnocylindria bacterium]|nr:hypothetical protein [Candidatus Limnocylindria bacterium]
MFVRKLVVALAFALILSTAPQIALAGTFTYAYAVTGRELFATPTLGVFAGTATGLQAGSWFAYIGHMPLSTTPPVLITGGSFSLATTTISGSAVTVSGTFSRGTVKPGLPGTNCTNQTYDVLGTLAQVGVGGGTGTGTFSAILTHYRLLLWGRYCVTYKATVTDGTVVLIF